jgi:shikimate dehydrogenase
VTGPRAGEPPGARGRILRFAVIGDPVSHSKSPAMHAAAYRALGLAHVYEAVRAAAGDLPRLVDALRGGQYEGLNVTVPHKERVLELVDAVDATAAAIGAANTLARSADGGVVAYNTDAPALAAELRRLAEGAEMWGGARALVIGSGGAARAGIAALAELGVAEIAVRARAFADPTRRDRFAASAPAPVRPEAFRASPSSERATVALVQATTAGMQGADPGEVVAEVVAWDALPAGAIAIDVVYAPRDTPFLCAARARGLRADDGLGMLARQGALALERWLGVTAPFDVMRAALEPRA